MLEEFSKSCALRVGMPTWSTCRRACVPTPQKRANFSLLRANVPINVPTYKRRTNVSTWDANVPKGVPIFQTSFLRNDKENFSILSLY